jgi:hypothetical protein
MNSASKANRQVDARGLVPQLLFIAIVLGLPLGLATAPSTFRDGDVSWQVATGEWILRHGTIPKADPFSFTAAGHPWVAMEWAAEIIYAAAFRLAGYAGLATVVGAALIALNAILFFYLQRRVSTVLLVSTLVMLNVVLAPFVLARPHVLAWPLLAGWTILLLKAAESGRPPPLWTALVLAVWTNVHASFPLAIAVGALIALDALVESKWKTLPQWLAFGAASLVAIMLNANGLAGLLQPFKTANLQMLPYIGEWHPSSPHSTPYFFAVLLLGLGGLLWSGIRFPVGRLLLLLALLGMAFAHVRHQSTFIIVACCVIPPLCRTRPGAAPVPGWLLLGAVPLLAYRAIWPLMPPESEANPRRLIAAIPAQLKNQPVLNGYTFGGPLILAGIKPFMDGRGEIYGDAFVRNYLNITDGNAGAFNRAVQRFDIRWTMLPWSDRRLIDVIESSPGWRRIYSDEIGVIDVRTSAAAGGQSGSGQERP